MIPLVSIITPSFNQARFLEKTIRSVLEQDYPRVEYLVADGGSTDGSQNIIQNYADRLAWWVSEKDRGQADAINKGITRARGEIVAWLNSDDYYLPGAISAAVRLLEENPEIGLVYGQVQVVDVQEHVLNHLKYDDWELVDLMTFHIIGQPAVFLRRSILDQVGLLDLKYHYLLDHQLWLRMGMKSGLKYQPSLWARAHFHDDCKNLAHAAEFGQDARMIVEWMKNEPDLAPLLTDNAKKVEAGAERLNAFYLLEAYAYKASFEAYWRSFWLNPATVIPEWYRMLYAFFAPLGLERWKKVYLDLRRKKSARGSIEPAPLEDNDDRPTN